MTITFPEAPSPAQAQQEVDYSFLYASLRTRQIIGELPVEKSQFSLALNDAGSLSATLPLRTESHVSVALSYAQLVERDDPILFVPMQERTGFVLNDEVGNQDGIAQGHTLRFPGPRGVGTGVDLSNFGAITFGNVPSFVARNEVSFEFWLHFKTLPANGKVIFTATGGSAGYSFDVANGALRFNRRTNASTVSRAASTDPIQTNTWYHVVGTYRGLNVNLYVDGILVGVAFDQATMPAYAPDVSFSGGLQVSALSIYHHGHDDTRIIEHSRTGRGEAAVFDRFSFSTETDVAALNAFNPRGTALLVQRNGVIVWSGILLGVEADLSNESVTISAQGWMTYLRNRRITSDLTFTQVEQVDILKALVDHSKQHVAGDIGITASHNLPTGVLRDRTYIGAELKSIGEAIEELSEVIDGFDFSFDASIVNGLYEVRLNTSYPNYGRLTNFAFEVGVGIDVLRYSLDGSGVVNRAHAINAQDQLHVVDDNEDAWNVFPLWEDVESFSDISVSSTLDQKAKNMLARGKRTTSRVSLRVDADTAPALGSYFVGDVVRVRSLEGLILDQILRIVELSVSIDENGIEEVNLTLVPTELFIECGQEAMYPELFLD